MARISIRTPFVPDGSGRLTAEQEEVIRPEDLEDRDSVTDEVVRHDEERMRALERERDLALAERDAAAAEKEEALAEKDVAVAEKEAALAEKETAVAEKEAALSEKNAAVAEKQTADAERETALAEKDAAVAEKEEALAERDALKRQIEEYENCGEKNQKLRQQIEELQHENGELFEELRELQVQLQQDLKYVAFYEKDETSKIDALVVFRSKLRELRESATRHLEIGSTKAYIFKSSKLWEQLKTEEAQIEQTLGQLYDMVENYEIQENEEALQESLQDTDSIAEHKEEAKRAIDELEKTLRQMRSLMEKFLEIKNTIKLKD